jgi:hypothetical protein
VARFASDVARHSGSAREGRRALYKVRRAGRCGYVWIREADLPEVVIKACELLKE